MTESEWLECTDSTPMLKCLRRKTSERKLRHFACSCCRDIWNRMSDERSRFAVEAAERFADGEATSVELLTAYNAASVTRGTAAWAAAWASEKVARKAARMTAKAAVRAVAWAAAITAVEAEEAAAKARLVGIFRDIFCNPFRPVAINSIWLTSNVTTLAQAAYEERILPSGQLDPARLAILSDALEEAGCDHADMLSHLRSPGPHVRGCWAVDLLLGKE